MRPSIRAFRDLEFLPGDLRGMLRRRAAEVTGLALLGAAAIIGVSLATWNVLDPSLNHATAAPVRNLLGTPGAIVSDLLMQFFGLGTLAILLPLAIRGWRFLSHRPVDREKLRMLAWIVAATLAAAAASSVPATGAWPLPTGLGGAIGDAVLRGLVAMLPAAKTGMALTVLGAIVGLFGLAAMLFASGIGFNRPRPVDAFDEDERDEDEADDGAVSLGALTHYWLAAKGRVGRLFGAGKARIARRRESEDEDYAAPVSRGPVARREPVFGRTPDSEPAPVVARAALPRRTASPPVAVAEPERDEPPFDVDETPEEEDEHDIPAPPMPATRGPASRIAAPERPRKAAPAMPPPATHAVEPDSYEMPPLQLLMQPKATAKGDTIPQAILDENARALEGVLEDFGVRGEIINVRPGPVVTLYELEPAPGIKASRVIGLADDIARLMSAVAARIAVVPGRNVIGIELPNAKRETVYLRELIAHESFTNAKARLPICLGKTIGGEPVIAELNRMPHLLIAGTTGSGKSVAINTMILSLLYKLKPEECRLIMVDPKMLELSVYDGIPHLLAPVVTDPKKAVVALKWAVREMEDRYKKMSKVGVRNIDGFNARVAEAQAKGETIVRTVQTGFDRETGEAIYEREEMDLAPLPYIVVIVDEMADLMMVAGKDIEGAVQRLAQMARAAGIHVVLATQRPSVDVITGTIKANFPTRISFQVTSKIDSRTILGEMGAEQLLGQGDMLYMAGGGRISRVHGPFVSDGEVEKVVAHLKSQGAPDYLDAVTIDEVEEEAGEEKDSAVFDKGEFAAGGGTGDLYEQAVQVVLRDKKASTSYVQRRLQIGYNRAASLIERMEKEGIVGPANHAGKREILVGEEAEAPY